MSSLLEPVPILAVIVPIANAVLAIEVEVERSGRIGEATVLDVNDLDTVAKNRTNKR